MKHLEVFKKQFGAPQCRREGAITMVNSPQGQQQVNGVSIETGRSPSIEIFSLQTIQSPPATFGTFAPAFPLSKGHPPRSSGTGQQESLNDLVSLLPLHLSAESI